MDHLAHVTEEDQQKKVAQANRTVLEQTLQVSGLPSVQAAKQLSDEYNNLLVTDAIAKSIAVNKEELVLKCRIERVPTVRRLRARLHLFSCTRHLGGWRWWWGARRNKQ